MPQYLKSGTIIAILIALMVVGFLVYRGFDWSGHSFQSSSNEQILNSTIFILALLSSIGIIFVLIGHGGSDEAFALPSGSIRALLAILLVVLFAVFGFSYLDRLAKGHVRSDTIRIPRAEVSDPALVQAKVSLLESIGIVVLKTDATKDPVEFSVLRSDPFPEFVTFGKDLFTVLGTLVASIVSFYFASKSVEASVAKAFGIKENIPSNQEDKKGERIIKSTTISFSTPNTISDTKNEFGDFQASKKIKIAGSPANSKIFTIKSISPAEIAVVEPIITEAAGPAITISQS